MFTLIQNGEVYGPEPMGHSSVLLGSRIVLKVGDIDPHAVERLGLQFEVVDATNCFVTPGIIDPHQHLLNGCGGSAE